MKPSTVHSFGGSSAASSELAAPEQPSCNASMYRTPYYRAKGLGSRPGGRHLLPHGLVLPGCARLRDTRVGIRS